MNVLVTGACGQLGREIQIVSRKSADNFFFTDVCEGCDRLDITDLDAVRAYVAANDINVILNCAAWTNVDAAEEPENLELVRKLNARAPENLAMAMAETGGLLVHISTDYVFRTDASDSRVYEKPLKEYDEPGPESVYGLTKLEGEKAIQGTGCRYLIIRTAWLYSEFGKNFVKTMLQLTSSKPTISVVNDQKGTPTYALDLAKAILIILPQFKESGIYHYSNEGECTWHEFATAIAELSGNENCKVVPCSSEDFPSKVRRPAYSVLDKTRIKSEFSVEVPQWLDSLKVCLQNLNALR